MPREQFLLNPYRKNDIYPYFIKKDSYSNIILFSQQPWIYINQSSTNNLDILVTWVINNTVLLFLVIRLQRNNNHHISTYLLEKSKVMRQFHRHLGAPHNCWLSHCSYSTVTWEKCMFYELLSHIPKNCTRTNRNTVNWLAHASTKFMC